ncbi:hypothetical protein BDR03DRAFT_1011945 [Suillus americanus]|nr:hypothetical protein BDR03DRAFT_1011945 [Suillus americanus]
MTSSSDSVPKTEKYLHEMLALDGSNYSHWATGFKIDEKEPSPPVPLSDPDQNVLRKEKYDEQVKLYKQRCLLALSALSTAIDTQDFKAIRFNQYLDWLFTIPKAYDSTSIAEMLQRLLWQQLLLPIHILLHALPDYYDPFCQTLINSSTPLNFNDIVNHLKTQELHHTTNSANAKHTTMFSGHQGAVNSPSKTGSVPPKGFNESKGDRWVLGWRPKYGHCAKAGHIWLQCHACLSKEEKNLKSASPVSSTAAIATNMEVSTADQPDTNAVSHPPSILSLKEHSANISSSFTVPAGSLHVDSAATAHMLQTRIVLDSSGSIGATAKV